MSEETTVTPAPLYLRAASFLLDLLPIALLVSAALAAELAAVRESVVAQDQISFKIYPIYLNTFKLYSFYIIAAELFFRFIKKLPGRTPAMHLLGLSRVDSDRKKDPNFFFGILHIIFGIYGFWLWWWPALIGKRPLHDRLFGYDILRLGRGGSEGGARG